MDGHGMNPHPIAVSTRIVEEYPIDLDLSTGILGTDFQTPTTHIIISSISLYLYHVCSKKKIYIYIAENLDHIFTNPNQWKNQPSAKARPQ